MGHILDGNSKHTAHAWRKVGFIGEKSPIRDCSRSNQMPISEWASNIGSMISTMKYIDNIWEKLFNEMG